ncbi:MAG: CDC48 family AAA ATPase [Planctomycetota bacterium]|nr:CDC48 family AAA ATPase [Planctomycetota bacterium]
MVSPNGRQGAPSGAAAREAGGIELRVGEAAGKDVGRAYARLDPEDLKRLGVGLGDAVLVRGSRATVCRAMPTFKEQRGKGCVHLDGLSRENAGVGLDAPVRIEKAACEPAESITLRPTNVQPSARDMEYIGSRLDGLTVMPGDRVRVMLFGSRSAEFVAEKTTPPGPVLIHPTTRLLVASAPAGSSANSGATPNAKGTGDRRFSYEDIGGLRGQVHRIREMIELPLRFPEVFRRLGIDPPKGVLLHGPPGCGKTLIARTIAHETDARFFTISGPEIVHKFYGESEAHLRKIWDEATRQGPSIIFIDEIDSIAPKRENAAGEVEKRIVAQLLALMDGLNRRSNVMVIAATNLPNALDPALRRPGRFDREIAIPIPDRHGRREILDIHSRGMPLAADVDMARIADRTHGFVGADLEALCREAAMACLRTIMPQIDFARDSIPYELISTLEVTMDHFEQALGEVEPSAVREVVVEVPNVRWDQIGGMDDVKRRLMEAVEWPLKHRELFARAGIKPSKGILLVGPPGVGKTLIAKAAATQTQVNFISVKGPELLSKFVGESEKGLREIFRKARQAAPCIVFFDEIDAIIPARAAGAVTGGDAVSERVLSQFLAEMDGVEELRDVLILGATNRRDRIDAAMLRPGRFDEVVELPYPDERARTEIFAVHLKGKPIEPGVEPATLARIFPGASGAQIAAACTRAGLAAIRRTVGEGGDSPRITREDLELAIRDLREAA